MLLTRPAMPRHKGKIEAGVKFAQNNALKGCSFESLAAQKPVSCGVGAAWPTPAFMAPRANKSARCSSKGNASARCRCRLVCSRCLKKRPRWCMGTVMWN